MSPSEFLKERMSIWLKELKPAYSSSSYSHWRTLNSMVKNRTQSAKNARNGPKSKMDKKIIYTKNP